MAHLLLVSQRARKIVETQTNWYQIFQFVKLFAVKDETEK